MSIWSEPLGVSRLLMKQWERQLLICQCYSPAFVPISFLVYPRRRQTPSRHTDNTFTTYRQHLHDIQTNTFTTYRQHLHDIQTIPSRHTDNTFTTYKHLHDIQTIPSRHTDNTFTTYTFTTYKHLHDRAYRQGKQERHTNKIGNTETQRKKHTDTQAKQKQTRKTTVRETERKTTVYACPVSVTNPNFHP